MQPSSSFVDRIIGAVRLDAATYEEVEHDSNATGQAVAVVAIVSILSGIGSTREGGTGALIGGVIAALVFWAIYALFVYVVGVYILRSPETSATFEQVLRPLGFSYAPSALAILGLIPAIGALIVFVASLWSLVASIVAIRQSLEVSTGRAVAIAIVAFLAMVIVLVLVVTVLGIGIYGIGSQLRPAG
jgi:hypothetical protein